ncbi:hypothetical protein AAIH17_35855, partial [Pseudomonas aeruginosa]|uniref:hypothetical protein n=1 Tax=Pseudomonas aeruginosa TaxID=287 RepID=UPI0031B6BD62
LIRSQKTPLRQLTNVKLPDALRLSGLLGELQYIEFARSCRPDKAFTPHPARRHMHFVTNPLQDIL